MYNERIAFYRKKNMLTQEELAEKINVSRQTITKWESRVIYPGLDYLIALSDVFGVSIDTLVKDDDCICICNDTSAYDSLVCFIVKAKRETYASKKGKVDSLRSGSQDYIFRDGEYTYYDSFFGSSFFSGQEVVYKKDQTIWSMNYYGRVLDDRFSGDFLKEALLQANNEYPYRGIELYKKGEYTYIMAVDGDINSFNGDEKIYYRSDKIYECLFHGGMLK